MIETPKVDAPWISGAWLDDAMQKAAQKVADSIQRDILYGKGRGVKTPWR